MSEDDAGEEGYEIHLSVPNAPNKVVYAKGRTREEAYRRAVAQERGQDLGDIDYEPPDLDEDVRPMSEPQFRALFENPGAGEVTL